MLTHEQMQAIAREWLAQEQLKLETSKDLTEWLVPIAFTGAHTPEGYFEAPIWASYAQCESDDGQEFDYAAILRPEIEKSIAAKGYPSLPDKNASWAVLVGLMTPYLKDLSSRALAYHEGRLDRPLTALTWWWCPFIPLASPRVMSRAGALITPWPHARILTC